MIRPILAASASGTLFALGLCIAGVVQPRVVLESFVIGPSWNPSMPLMFLGALAVHAPISWLIRKRKVALSGAPLAYAHRPTWDPKLVLGAVVFGVGWGLSGICPGPMVVSAFTFGPGVLALIAGFALGSWIAPLLSTLHGRFADLSWRDPPRSESRASGAGG